MLRGLSKMLQAAALDGLAIPPEFAFPGLVMSSATKCLIWPSKQARRCPFSILTSLSSGDDTAPRNSWRVVVAKSEPKMHAETMLRKLRLQEALSEDELNAYLKKVKSDGALPISEVLVLFELGYREPGI